MRTPTASRVLRTGHTQLDSVGNEQMRQRCHQVAHTAVDTVGYRWQPGVPVERYRSDVTLNGERGERGLGGVVDGCRIRMSLSGLSRARERQVI